MTVLDRAQEHFSSLLQARAEKPPDKRMPPIFTFLCGVDEGFQSDISVTRFTSLDEDDTRLIMAMVRVLAAGTSMRIFNNPESPSEAEWEKFLVHAHMPIAVTPEKSVVGAHILYTPTTIQTRKYWTIQKPEGVSIAYSSTWEPVHPSDVGLVSLVRKTNPFISYHLPGPLPGISFAGTTIELPQGFSGNIRRDLDDFGSRVKGSPLTYNF